jgi:transcriptional antiterminator RfaH
MDKWYVLFSKPNQENQVRDQLLRRSVRVYLPFLPDARRARGARPRPLFPRYLFACLDLGIIAPDTVRWLPGLTSFVTFGDDYAMVDDALIAHIERRLAQMQHQAVSPFRPGQSVRLPPDHPMAMLDAVFEKPMSDQKRACILVTVLGRLTRCEVDMSLLQASDALAWFPG